jgi:hypothetical protein
MPTALYAASRRGIYMKQRVLPQRALTTRGNGEFFIDLILHNHAASRRDIYPWKNSLVHLIFTFVLFVFFVAITTNLRASQFEAKVLPQSA